MVCGGGTARSAGPEAAGGGGASITWRSQLEQVRLQAALR